MNIELSTEQEAIREAVQDLCSRFPESYWLERDADGVFPHDFYRAMGDAGWLGTALPEEYGGAGLGVQEACVVMQTIAESGACMSGASSVHINIFGLMPVVVYGTEEQKRRMLPPIARGEVKACFGVTEPNAGLNTTKLKTRAVRQGDKYVVHGQKVWISTAQVADKILLLARTTALEDLAPGQHSHGLTLFYTDLDRSLVAKGIKTSLHPSLVPSMERHTKDKKEVEFDRLRVKQALALLLKDVRTAQDLRDALPNQLTEMIDQIKGMERSRPEGFTLMTDPRKIKQYQKLREKIEFYTAARLLY